MCVLVRDESSQVNPGITPQGARRSSPRDPPIPMLELFFSLQCGGGVGAFPDKSSQAHGSPKRALSVNIGTRGSGGILLVIREHVHITTQQHLWSTCELLSFTCLVLRTFVLESVYARKMVTRTRACMAPDMQSMFVCLSSHTQ